MSEAAASRWSRCAQHIDLKVRLTPRAAKDEITQQTLPDRGFAVEARVRALPAQGAANRALEILCAKWLCVPRSSVSVAKGHKSRIKTLRLTGNLDDLESRLKRQIPA